MYILGFIQWSFALLVLGLISACGGGSSSGGTGSASSSSSSSSSSGGGVPTSDMKGDPDAEVSTVIERLDGPDSVTLINSSSLYISKYEDGGGDSIHQYSVSGNLLGSIEGLNGPLGTAVNSEGSLYFASNKGASEGYVYKFDEGGVPELVATVPGWPTGLVVDDSDNIYVANYDVDSVHRITPTGEVELISSDNRLSGSVGIVYAENSLWLANYNSGRILHVQLDGEVTEIVAANAQSNMGIGYMTYYNNMLYATDIERHLILEISLSGDISILAGTTQTGQLDGGGDVATFNMPNGITVDPDLGILYISEYLGGLRSVVIP